MFPAPFLFWGLSPLPHDQKNQGRQSPQQHLVMRVLRALMAEPIAKPIARNQEPRPDRREAHNTQERKNRRRFCTQKQADRAGPEQNRRQEFRADNQVKQPVLHPLVRNPSMLDVRIDLGIDLSKARQIQHLACEHAVDVRMADVLVNSNRQPSRQKAHSQRLTEGQKRRKVDHSSPPSLERRMSVTPSLSVMEQQMLDRVRGCS